jgi:hypothetical protein
MTAQETPTTRLYLICGLCGLLAGIYSLLEVEPAMLVWLFLRLAPPVAVATWLTTDAKKHRVAEVYDAGLLFYFTWFFILPWYASRTAGAEGKWRLIRKLYALGLATFIGDALGALGHLVVYGGAKHAA